MRNFNKKLKEIEGLFIYKFRFYDYTNHKLKIYLISPDGSHIYISVNNISNKSTYNYELGDLYFDINKNKVFEDEPFETGVLNDKDYNFYKKKYEKISTWDTEKIKNIIDGFGFNKIIV